MFNRSTHSGQTAGWFGGAAVAGILLTLLLLVAVVFTLEAAGPQADSFAHLYYAPIILSAFLFGALGGAAAAIGAALLNHPAVVAGASMVDDPSLHLWLIRAFFFLFVGAAVGLLADRLRYHAAREQRQRAQLSTYYHLDHALLDNHRLDDVLSQFTAAVGELSGADRCSLYLLTRQQEWSRASDWVRPATRPGDLTDLTANGNVTGAGDRWGLDIARLASEHKTTVSCRDVRNCNCTPQFDARRIDGAGLRCVVAVPLRTPTDDYGALCIGYANPCRVTDEAEPGLRQLAHRAAVTIKNARGLEDWSRLAHETLAAVSQAVEQRDGYSQGHVDRVEQAAAAVAARLGLPEQAIKTVRYAAQLHDIGKLTTPTQILQKPAPLSEPEWRQMEQHPVVGSQILERVSALRDAALLVRHHHERYDGGGYPAGLAGSEIPLGARIIAVADAYDAMTTNRPYRKALSASQAINELKSQAGRQFDPLIVLAFLQLLDQPGLPYTTTTVAQAN